MVALRAESRRPWPADIERLRAHSLRVREFLSMVERNPHRAADPRFGEALGSLLTEVRLDLRVAVDLPQGVREPRNEGEALAFMRAPNFVGSTHHAVLRRHVSRHGTDARLQVTVDRLIDDAGKLGVPLWPSLLNVPAAQQDAWHGEGESDLRGGESPFNLGRCVQLGHGVYRHLPWACWDAVDLIVARAGAATGYRLERLGQVPGEYQLRSDAPKLAEADALRLGRLQAAESRREERERLWTAYAGGDWVDELGEVHPSGFGPVADCEPSAEGADHAG